MLSLVDSLSLPSAVVIVSFPLLFPLPPLFISPLPPSHLPPSSSPYPPLPLSQGCKLRPSLKQKSTAHTSSLKLQIQWTSLCQMAAWQSLIYPNHLWNRQQVVKESRLVHGRILKFSMHKHNFHHQRSISITLK